MSLINHEELKKFYILAILLLPLILNMPLIAQTSIPPRAYFAIPYALAGLYILQLQFVNGIFKTISNLIVLFIIIVSSYYISVFFDAANRQVKADILRANMMVERIRTHKNYEKEPLQLNIYGLKTFSVIGWKDSIHQPFNYMDGKFQALRYFTDLNFTKMSN